MPDAGQHNPRSCRTDCYASLWRLFGPIPPYAPKLEATFVEMSRRPLDERHATAGLRRDHDGGAAVGNHLTEFFQQHRRAVKIDLQDRRDGLLTGDTHAAWIRAFTSPRPLSVLPKVCTDVRSDTSTIKTVVLKPVSSSTFVLLPQIRRHHIATAADPPGDGLADRACAHPTVTSVMPVAFRCVPTISHRRAAWS